MSMREEIQEHIEVMTSLNALEGLNDEAIDLCVKTLRNGGKIFICGNGGSASDAQHIAAEFIGRFTVDRKPLAAICLNTDTSVITCITNDFSYNDVFSRQLFGLAGRADLLIVFSTSGNSENIIQVCNAANELDIPSIAYLGKGGGRVKAVCSVPIVVASDSTVRIQEAHIFLGHHLCGEVEKRGFLPDG